MTLWLSMQTHNTEVVSSFPPCVAFKTPLVRKATGNHLMNSTSLEKSSEPCLWFLLSSKSSMRRSSLVKAGVGKLFRTRESQILSLRRDAQYHVKVFSKED